MKTCVYLILLMDFVAAVGYAGDYRRMTSDMYRDSYEASMRRMVGVSAAETRAGEYRGRYEICDADHICTNATSGAPVLEIRKPHNKLDRLEKKDSIYVPQPIWL